MFSFKKLGLMLLFVTALALLGCQTKSASIKYRCEASSGTTSDLQYGLSGFCTFTNYGDAVGNACVTVRLRENGAIVNQERLCASVPSEDSVKKEFFMGQALNKQYTWDAVSS